MKYLKLLLVIYAALLIAGCSGSKMSQVKAEMKVDHDVRKIALFKVVGELDTAIADDLVKRGYDVTLYGDDPTPVMTKESRNMEITKPGNLKQLLNEGYDACLIVKSDHDGYDTTLRAAEVRMYSTHMNALIAGVSWKNAQGGFQGSFVDMMVRKGIFSAAEGINDELLKQLQHLTQPDTQ